MSRQFDGVDDTVEVDGIPGVVAKVPFTMAVWFKVPNTTARYYLMWVGVSTQSNRYWDLRVDGTAAAPKPLQLETNQQGSLEILAAAPKGYQANKWHHACGVITSNTNRTIYLDGENAQTGTSSLNPLTGNATIDRLSLGRQAGSAPGNYLNGRLAHACVFNRALTQNEVRQLLISPTLIRKGLVAYYRLPGLAAPEPNFIDGTKNLSSVYGAIGSQDEPPISHIFVPEFSAMEYSFKSPQAVPAVAAAPAVGGVVRRRLLMGVGL